MSILNAGANIQHLLGCAKLEQFHFRNKTFFNNKRLGIYKRSFAAFSRLIDILSLTKTKIVRVAEARVFISQLQPAA